MRHITDHMHIFQIVFSVSSDMAEANNLCPKMTQDFEHEMSIISINKSKWVALENDQ